MFINEFFNKEQGLTEAANPAQQAAIAIAKKKKKGVAEDAENFNGIDISLEIQKDDEYVDDEDYDNQVIYVTASSNGRELGHVLFSIDGEYLMPQDLEVEERFRGQGIAQTMYDYVKSKGYKIRRSGQQTDAGAGFWDKHKGQGQNVWEQGVAEAGSFSYGAKKPRKGSVADLAAKKRQEQEQGQQPIEPKDQQVGVARVTKGVAEAGPAQGEYSRVLTALRLYYPRFEIEELNTPDWHRVIANKANVTPEYAGQVINDFVKDSQPDEEENLDWMDDTNDVREGVAEGAVEDLAKDLKNPHSYNAIDHMMQTIADKSNVTPKELHNQFVEKYGMTPDEWIKNEQGVEETYGAKLHTEYKRNRFKQLEKIKQQQEKALGLGEAGCNMTYEGRYCSEHGMMECPGYSMTETSVQDKLHQQHQELRKQRGLPDPSYYKKLAAQKQAEIAALRAEIAADRAKSMKESLRPGERHHYEDDPKTGKRVYKGIRGDQYDAPKKTTGHEPDADRDRAAHRAHDRSMTESIESYMEELDRAGYGLQEEKVRLDPKCWKGKKIGSPKTKVKGGVRVNNCVPK